MQEKDEKMMEIKSWAKLLKPDPILKPLFLLSPKKEEKNKNKNKS